MLPLVIIKQKTNFQKLNYPKDHCLHSWQQPETQFSQVSSLWGGWRGANSQGWRIPGAWQEATGTLFPLSFSLCSKNFFLLQPLQVFFPPEEKRREQDGKSSLVPSPKSTSYCSQLANLKAIEGLRQTNEVPQPSPPVWFYQEHRPGAERPSRTLAQEVTVHLLERLWAPLEALGIKSPIINRHWLGFRGERRLKVPEKI